MWCARCSVVIRGFSAINCTTQRELIKTQSETLEILKQDYHIQDHSIPLRVKTNERRNANNKRIINEIIDATKFRIPELKINLICWLRDRNSTLWPQKRGKKIESVVNPVVSKKLAREVVQKGTT